MNKIIQYIKDIIDADKTPRLHACVALSGNIVLMLIALILTVASIFTTKDITKLTITSYCLLSAHSWLTYNAGNKANNISNETDEINNIK